eukprot:RCo039733
MSFPSSMAVAGMGMPGAPGGMGGIPSGAMGGIGGVPSGPGSDAVHRNLMVNFLPPTWTSAELRGLFQQFGEIEECKVVMDRTTGNSKGYGFVKFVNRNDAENAMAQVQGFQAD